MCKTNVFLLKESGGHLVIGDVDIGGSKGDDTWRLIAIFGDQNTVKRRMR